MTGDGEELHIGEHAPPRAADGPEQWLGAADPVETFGNTIDKALRELSVELAGIRAERDGLRLELEGLRTQLELTQQRLGDRERFTATVRELHQIVQNLSVPPSWQTAAPPTVAYETPVGAATVAAPRAEPTPTIPEAPEAPVAAAAAAVTTAPEVPAPSPLPPDPTPAPPPPAEPAAFVASATEVASPAAAPTEPWAPAPPPPQAPEPEPEPESPYRRVEPESTARLWEATAPGSALQGTEDRFFDQPGVWLGEPDRGDAPRFDRLRTWGRRIGTGIVGLIVVVVLLVSVGPRVLPYQTYFVRSGSMAPTIDTGDMIVLGKTDANDIQERDIITFERPDRPGTLVTHRVVAIERSESGGRQFQTKGDANAQRDSWRVPASGTGWKYAFAIPKLGYVLGYLGTPQVRLAMLAIPALILGVLSLLDIWKAPPAPRRRS